MSMKLKIPTTAYARGTLRLLEEEDLALTLEWRNLDANRRWFKFSDKLSFDAHLKWFADYKKKTDDFIFIACNEKNEPIGQLAIYNIQKKRAEVGRFVVSRDYQGKGFMKDAIIELLRIAHNELGLLSVFLEARSENDKAIGLYKGLGFMVTNRNEEFVSMEKIL